MRYITGAFYDLENPQKFSDACLNIFDSINSETGVYCSDNLFTFSRNLSFLKDVKFMQLFKKYTQDNPQARGILWRTATLIWGGANGLKLEGDFVECGCYRGITAKIIYDYFDLSSKGGKKYYLYDLFEYEDSFAHHSMPAHSKSLYQEVKNLFKNDKNALIINGKLPDILEKNAPEKISFLHLDLNNVEGEISTLEVLFDKLVSGAIIILDDFGWFGYREQCRAELKWFANKGYQILEMPTGQGMVIKT